LPVTRQELGLPSEGPLILCPQSAFKYHPDFDEALAQILRKLPNATIALSAGTEPHWNELLTNRFKQTMPTGFERIFLLPRVEYEKYRGLLALADVIIDPKHFTGGHTTYMAFSVGTPVVTWKGDRMSGRMTYGLYSQMGLTPLAAETPEEFSELVGKVVENPDYREELKTQINSNSDKLFDDIESVREFESVIQSRINASFTQ